MMKRLYMMAALALLCFVTAGCPEKPEEKTIDIKGEWQLSQITTKASIGGQTVNVYIAFLEGGNFELYQQLGEGRYRHYTGSWTLNENTLSGTYSGGAAWATSYTVEIDDAATQLVLTAADGSEVHTYRKQAIPADVTANALEP